MGAMLQLWGFYWPAYVYAYFVLIEGSALEVPPDIPPLPNTHTHSTHEGTFQIETFEYGA